MEKLSTQYNPHWSLLRWVASFLQGRAQVTRVGALVSAPLYLNGGIPQGTKLGPVLFAVMVNDLVQSWGACIKFVVSNGFGGCTSQFVILTECSS